MQNWTKHTSSTYNCEYWFNCRTNESTWEKPQEVIDSEKNAHRKLILKKLKEHNQRNKVKKQELVTEKTPVIEKKTVIEKTPVKKRDDTSHSMQIANGNGMSWTIQGESHWTQEDYLDKLRDINQSMRDF